MSSFTCPSGVSMRIDAALYTPQPSRTLLAKFPVKVSELAYLHVPYEALARALSARKDSQDRALRGWRYPVSSAAPYGNCPAGNACP